ncbi:hypothetical protein BKA93DRAFT_826313 [Sparassis latifolia]
MEEAEETEIPVNPVYLTLFSDHLNRVRGHLLGGDGPGSLPASFLEPNAYWTTAEKDAFFHGLTIYSRLRPDLIAAEIKTKTVADVCVYLGMLEDGSAHNPHSSQRQDIPASREVSDRWLAFEEQQAFALSNAEPILEEQALQKTRDDEFRTFRLATRARKGDDRTASNERDREGEKRRQKKYKAWLAERQEEWKGEDVLRALDTVAMKALNRILRKDEDVRWPTAPEPSGLHRAGKADEVQERAGSSTAIPFLPVEALHRIDEEMIDPILRAQSQSTSVSDNFALPAAPMGTVAGVLPHAIYGAQFRPSTPPFQGTSITSDSLRQSVAPAHTVETSTSTVPGVEQSLSPASRRRLQKRMHMRRKRAEESGSVISETVEKLKTGPKRKKMRGEAGASIVEHAGGGDVDPIERQHDKVAAARKGTDERDQQRADDDPSSSEDEDVKGSYRHPHPSGPTLPEKLRDKYKAMGITAERLYEEGLGLLHLGGLAKIMRLYNELRKQRDVPPSVASQISVDLVRILNAHVVKFTTKLVHRSIVSGEQERLAKMHTKVWGLKNKIISPVDVEHALMMMYSERPSKKAHFKGLLDRLDIAVESAAESDEEEDLVRSKGTKNVDSKGGKRERRPPVSRSDDSSSPSQPEDNDSDADADEGRADAAQLIGPPHLSLHQTIFTPFVRLPSFTPLPSVGYSAPTDPSLFMPCPTSTLLSGTAEPPVDEELMPCVTRGDTLMAELLEDEELEKHDSMEDEQHEKRLWSKFASDSGEDEHDAHVSSKRKRIEDSSDVDEDNAQAKRDEAQAGGFQRYRQPDPNGPVKSRVYISDSD